ncbi:MAG: pseudaminic acid synthase, partial [Methanomicrobiales archaeon]|nr:pseudaminic acid synthase [Methanomicrobiales archaeon]
GRCVGPHEPVYIVAEISANHHQSFEEAGKLIRVARKVGADAVKLQTYTPDTLTIPCENQFFRIRSGSPWEGKTLYDLYAKAYTPWEWHKDLKEVAANDGIALFSTPFDTGALEFLEGLNMPAYKIASFEMVDLPLVRRVGETGKPVILSTGMATLKEIREAVQTLRQTGNTQIALLKCTTAYPAPREEMNLRTIPHLAAAFELPVGLSDHSLGLAAPVAAVALGACIIEKHLTISRSEPGPDAGFSLEPDEFRTMVEAVRETEKALGEVSYGPTPHEEASIYFRRSLFIVRDMGEDEVFTDENVRSIRPGYGLPPKYISAILGKRAAKAIPRGTPLAWDLIA